MEGENIGSSEGTKFKGGGGEHLSIPTYRQCFTLSILALKTIRAYTNQLVVAHVDMRATCVG